MTLVVIYLLTRPRGFGFFNGRLASLCLIVYLEMRLGTIKKRELWNRQGQVSIEGNVLHTVLILFYCKVCSLLMSVEYGFSNKWIYIP
jgi:hypothetical protein